MKHPESVVREHEPDRVGPRRACAGIELAGSARGVVALAAIEPGEVILRFEGVLVTRPSRYSVQVGASLHLDLPPDIDPESAPARYLWRYLNHSCDPNAACVGTALVALRAIVAGEPITFNYDTTEAQLAEPFACTCGHCDGRIVRGFDHLPVEAQERLRPMIAAHLRRPPNERAAG